MVAVVGLAVLAGSGLREGAALADDGQVVEPSRPAAAASVEETWYGWQVGAVDLGSAGLLLAATRVSGGGAGGSLLAIAGTAGYLFGGPIVHGFQGRDAGVVAGSLGLRLLVPILGFVVGSVAGQSAVSRCEAKGASEGDGLAGGLCGLDAVSYGLMGAGVGMLAASTIDAIGLSWKPDRRRRDTPSSTAFRPAQTLAPMLGARDAHLRRGTPRRSPSTAPGARIPGPSV